VVTETAAAEEIAAVIPELLVPVEFTAAVVVLSAPDPTFLGARDTFAAGKQGTGCLRRLVFFSAGSRPRSSEDFCTALSQVRLNGGQYSQQPQRSFLRQRERERHNRERLQALAWRVRSPWGIQTRCRPARGSGRLEEVSRSV
jgi:hypothetical protein